MDDPKLENYPWSEEVAKEVLEGYRYYIRYKKKIDFVLATHPKLRKRLEEEKRFPPKGGKPEPFSAEGAKLARLRILRKTLKGK